MGFIGVLGFNFFAIGILYSLSIYHILVYFGRKTDLTNLYYASFCFFHANIIIVSNIQMLFEDIETVILRFLFMLLINATQIVLALFIVEYLKIICKESFRKRVNILILFATFLNILLASLFLYTRNIDFYITYFFIVLTFVVVFLILFLFNYEKEKRKLLKRHDKLMIIGIIAIIICLSSQAIFLSVQQNINFSIFYSLMLIFILSMAWQLTSKFNSEHNTLVELTNTLEEKVNERTIQLKEANQQKTNLFINLAHETKTPLTLIRNYLNDYIEGNRTKSKNLQIVKQNVDKLCRDILNYMDIEKLERNQILYNHDKIIEISEIIKNKITFFKKIAEQRNIVFTSDIKENIVAKADPDSIDRIMNNLIDNAIKYIENEGEIKVSLKIKNKEIIFTVEDTGIGISEEQQEKIFLPYYQISYKKSNLQGMGMGLNIIKKIVESLNGKIEVKSKLEKGSVFTVIIPQYTLKENDKVITQYEYSEPITGSVNLKIPDDNYQDGRPNILLVEDNIEMLSYLHNNLRDTYNTFSAVNGKKAIRKIYNTPKPDIIISDIMMDEMDGYEFYKSIQDTGKYNDTPFIFLTAKTTQEEKLKGLGKGAVDYIYKPFSIEELTAKIKSILKTKNAQKKVNMDEIKYKMLSFFNSGDGKDKKYIIFKSICDNYNITSREKDVLHQLFKGLENKEICDELNISIETVKTHIKNIFRKCNVQNRVELVRLFSDSI